METMLWGDALVNSLQNMWIELVAFVPGFLGAMLVLILGLILASVVKKIIEKTLQFMGVDVLVKKFGLLKQMRKLGIEIKFSQVVGWLVKWFIIVAVLLAVADILNLTAVSDFLHQIFIYIPNVIVAVIILAIGLVLGEVSVKVVTESVTASHLIKTSNAEILSALAKWSIVIFAVMAAMVQLGIAVRLIEITFSGLIAMLALAGGLAFGLGGKDKVREWLANTEERENE